MRKQIAYFAIGILVLGVFALSATSTPAPRVKVMPVPEPIQIASQPTRMITTVAYSYSDEEYTHLKISPGREHLRLQPGENEEITVTVTNPDDEVHTEPHLVTLPFDDDPIESDWIKITPACVNISSDSKQEYTIAVEVPDNAGIGHYHSTIAFTDDAIGEGPYPKHLNTFELSLEIWMPPKVQILTRHIYDQIEAGRTYDYTIELENTGDDPIAIDPEIEDNDRRHHGYMIPAPAFTSDAITITAPDEIKAGGTATVEVHIAVPDDARGRYEGSIDLNIDDPGIREYEGRVHLSFEVIRYPTEPFVRHFNASDDAQVTIEITAHNWRATDVEPSFVVSLAGPDGNSVDIGRTMKTHKGSVSFGFDGKMGMPYLSYPMPVPPGGTRDAADNGYSETSTHY
ncbi:MAG: hypothetical protein U9N07_09045, partial [Euryarchaeota archaeon]|nr:hypothetical protein [Euryarchaeota archaeon]